jgi:predicted ATPase
MAAQVLWCLGHPAQAVQRSQEALAVQTQADALVTLATAQGFPFWIGVGTYCQGCALALQDQSAAALAILRQSLTAVLATEWTLARPLWLALLAEAVGHADQVAEGLRLLAEALTAFEASGRGDGLTEAYRLQGELLLRQGPRSTWAAAEACFQQALAIARHQQAKSWELRAALSLSRLWQQQGRRAEACELLAPLYDWVTEGFDTADLQAARALLDALEA